MDVELHRNSLSEDFTPFPSSFFSSSSSSAHLASAAAPGALPGKSASQNCQNSSCAMSPSQLSPDSSSEKGRVIKIRSPAPSDHSLFDTQV